MTCSTFQVKTINDINEESENIFTEEFDVILEEEEENKMNTNEKSQIKSSAKPPVAKRAAKVDTGKRKDRSSPKKAKPTLKKQKKTGETTVAMGRKKLDKVKKSQPSKILLPKTSPKKSKTPKSIVGKKDDMRCFDNDSLPMGWKKELVTRKSGASAGKVDIYIYSPDGTKFRSKVELAAYLLKKKSMLTVERFGFGKKPEHKVSKASGSSSKLPAGKVTKSISSSPRKSEESPKKSLEKSPKKSLEKSPQKENVLRFRVDMTPSQTIEKRVVPKAVWLQNRLALEKAAAEAAPRPDVTRKKSTRKG